MQRQLQPSESFGVELPKKLTGNVVSNTRWKKVDDSTQNKQWPQGWQLKHAALLQHEGTKAQNLRNYMMVVQMG